MLRTNRNVVSATRGHSRHDAVLYSSPTNGDCPMRFCFVMVLLSTQLVSPQEQKEAHTFPTKDQIQLLLTQSDRAFDEYEQTLTQEAAAGGDLGKSAIKDKKLLVNARELLGRLKRSPDLFNSPGGFILVGDLDDASRNMSLCMGQAGLASGTEAAA
jgi:hypothetical protein